MVDSAHLWWWLGDDELLLYHHFHEDLLRIYMIQWIIINGQIIFMISQH